MSIERLERKGGVVWRVRWRDEHGRNRSKVLGRKRDAEAFDAEVRRLKRTRELGQLDAGKQTLAEFGQDWWTLHAEPQLAKVTLELYAMLWDVHILPRLGELKLRDLTAEEIQRFRVDLEAAGVGPVSIRKALTLLHGILQRAVEWGRIPVNPAAAIRKPKAKRTRTVQPLPPVVVERIRRYLLERRRMRDTTLVSVLAYAGLRPGEALALSWAHIREHTILVERAASLGEIAPTKTGQTRTVRLLQPLAKDLAEWRLASGRPDDSALIFPGLDGGPWTREQYQNWRKRIYVPTTKACGVDNSRPYDLRHSFISLLIHEGLSVVEVARQAGHSPEMTLSTYAHVFDEHSLGEHKTAEDQIRAARSEDVPVLYPREGADPQIPSRGGRIRTADLLLPKQAR
ncbi:MAG TPA: tyrosine-type recombinase/integrase [Solirubrobacterales bacterium]